MSFKLEIEKTIDGFILIGEDYKSVVELDYSDIEDSKPNREQIQSLLYRILDYFGERGSKHDQYRIEVNVIKPN